MADFTPYTTKPGDRWDLIADEAYGDPNDYERIIDANPGVAKNAVLKSGIKLLIPVVDRSNELISGDTLPPWKR